MFIYYYVKMENKNLSVYLVRPDVIDLLFLTSFPCLEGHEE